MTVFQDVITFSAHLKFARGEAINISPAPPFPDMAIKDTVRMVADLMEVAARTAPKGVGKDFLEIKVLTDEERIAVGK